MDYEKAYKNLVAKVKNAYLFAQTDSTKKVLEDILPELRESEDERTRKRLMEFISDVKRISESGRRSWAVRKDDAEMCDAFLAYLEKQKEQPEVDLEKEVDRWFGEKYMQNMQGLPVKPIVQIIARHFYNFGLNARKGD